MVLTGHEDLRIKRTITAIKQSFEELICEKDYEKITVKELCDRAMVNKKTFYHYYPTLDDLLAETQGEMMASYLERIKDYTLPDDLEKVNREFFLYSAEQGVAYEKITCSVSYGHIRQEMVSGVMDATWSKSKQFKALSPYTQRIVLGMINTVSLLAYRQWIEEGKQTPLEEVIALTNRLICRGVSGIFSGRKSKIGL